MPLYDSDGEEVEGAFTAEEVEAQLEEAKTKSDEKSVSQLEESQKTNDEATQALQDKLDEANEALGKEKEKDKNFKGLRDSKGKSDDKIAELVATVKGLETKIEEKIGGLTKDALTKKVDDAIKGVSGEDKEMSDKIKFHYEKLTGEEDFTTRMQSAIVLATGGNQSVLQGSAISSGGFNPTPSDGNEPGELSADLKEVAKKAGLSDAEIENAKKIL